MADPHRVAILGASGGGYAALRGVTTTPDLYSCAVDIYGPSDIKTPFGSMTTWWHASKPRWIRRVGDVEHDEEWNRRISPLYDADKAKVPVLVEQRQNDPRVSEKNSALMVAAMRAKNIPVTYVVYPDEGHGFYRPENWIDSIARIDEFLKKYLGGRRSLGSRQPARVPSCADPGNLWI